MARRSRNNGLLGDLFDVLSDIFSVVPPWLCLPLAAVAWVAIYLWFAHKTSIVPFRMLGHFLGGAIAFTILAAGFAGWLAHRKRQQFLATNINWNWVQNLSWQEFEIQVGEVYRNRGYQVERTGGNGPDGGIDLKLQKDGRTTLVQCKHWKTWKVGVKTVRELFGVMCAEHAHAGILMTSGRFTEEARRFAQGKAIELVEQEQFIQLIQEFQRELRGEAKPETSKPETSKTSATAPHCPRCNSSMVLRTAKAGAKAGRPFWGCSTYPKCRGIREL